MKLKFRMVPSSTATSFEPRPRGAKHVTQAFWRQPKALRIHGVKFQGQAVFSTAFWKSRAAAISRLRTDSLLAGAHFLL